MAYFLRHLLNRRALCTNGMNVSDDDAIVCACARVCVYCATFKAEYTVGTGLAGA